MLFRTLSGLRLAAVALAATLVLSLSACSSSSKKTASAPRKEPPVEVLYNQALDDLTNQDFQDAAEGFDFVERQYPYSVWATKAQLMATFAYYMVNEYDLSIAAAERFIRLNPGNEQTPYAHYMVAVAHYEQIADVERDQGRTRQALEKLEEVIRRYPRSAYAQDAQAKLALTRDHLAGKQMSVGRYYLTRGHYVAAINRFQNVIEEYQTTSHTPEALHRLVESYLSLGVNDEAQATAAVLGHNFPRSSWYRDSYALLQGRDLSPSENKDSWIARVWNSIF